MTTVRRVLILAVSLIFGVLLLSPSPASAHTGFESSDPPDGSTVDEAVGDITLRFSGPAEPAGEGFVVLGPSGTVRTPDLITADPARQAWTLSFDPPLAAGAVGIRWTVQAPDAHPIDGSFSFTVTAPNPEPVAEENLDGDVESNAETEQAAEATTAGQNEDPESAADSSSDVDTADDSSANDRPETTTQSLDEFLTKSATSAPNADGIGAFGRLVAFIGTMLGIGGLAFVVAVIGNHRRDTVSVLKAVRYSGAIVVIGTLIDLVAHLAVANNGWTSFWPTSAIESVSSSAFGLATGLRIAAGALLYVAAKLAASRLSAAAPAVDQERILVGAAGPSTTQDEDDTDLTGTERGGGISISPSLAVAVLLLLVSFTFDGHTVTAGNRWITGAVDMLHVVAGSVWAGGAVVFAVVLWQRHRRLEQLYALELAMRFSTIAGAAVAAAGIAGIILAVLILESVSELWSTPWGQLLIVKIVAVFAAASVGAYNHFVVIPWMEAQPTDGRRSIRLRNAVTCEAALLVVVLTVTAFLVGAAS